MSHCEIKIPKNLLQDLKKLSIKNDAAVEVYYLEAVLGGLPGSKIAKSSTDNTKLNLITPNGYHTGVGFRVITSSGLYREFVFDLTANDFGKYVLVPKIDYTSKTFEWCNGAFYNFEPVIDRTYWGKSSVICTITPQDLLEMIDWLINDYIPKHQTYILLTLIKEINRKDIFNPVKHSCLCDDCCYDIYRYLQNEKGVAINYFTVPQYNVAAIKIGQNGKVEEIPENDPRVYNFFAGIDRIITIILSDSITEKRKVLKELLDSLSVVGIEHAREIVEEIVNDMIAIGQDAMIILSSINLDPSNPDIQKLSSDLQKFMQDKTIANLLEFLAAVNKFVKDSDSPQVKAANKDIREKMNDLVMIVPKIMSQFKTFVYYGYKEDRTMGYFLVNSTENALYINYLDTDLMRDVDFLDIYGRKSTDIYSKNTNRKLIHNYNCSKNKLMYISLGIIILLIVIIIILIFSRK